MPRNMPPNHPEAAQKNLNCGNCQWFSSSFAGRSCQVIREVEPGTIACIEYTSIMKDIFHELTKDKCLLEIREELRSNKFKLDASVINEINGYRINTDFTRNFRFGSKQDPTAIVEALGDIMAYRARVSFIYTSCIDMRYDFEKCIERASSWIQSKYSTLLKNDAIRKAALNRALPEAVTINSSIQKIMATIEYIEKSMGATEWTLRNILGTLEKQFYSRENNLNNGTRQHI